MIFQIPLGDHPFQPGERVRSRAHPWWGVGTVIEPGGIWPSTGMFSVRWEGDGGGISRGQVAQLQLVAVPASTPDDGPLRDATPGPEQ